MEFDSKRSVYPRPTYNFLSQVFNGNQIEASRAFNLKLTKFVLIINDNLELSMCESRTRQGKETRF